jgi:hypothetical protein
MTQVPPASAGLTAIPPKPWYSIWWIALTRPSEAPYATLTEDPHATSRRAYNWMVLSGLFSGAVNAWLSSQVRPATPLSPEEALRFGTATVARCLAGPFLSALGALLWLAFSAWLVQRIARALGGEGTYAKLAYLFAAFQAPTLLASVLYAIPFPYLHLVGLGLGLYSLLLTAISVKAVNGFTWERAWVASSPVLAVNLLLLTVTALVS